MRRVLPLLLLCDGVLLSTPALADNICLRGSDPQLTFPGTRFPYVFAVTDDPTFGYGISLCSPTALDLSWFYSYGFGDFNHDGFEDLMLGRSSKSGGEVQLFYNDGTGSGTTVLSATLPTGTATPPVSVTAVDLTGDGWDDVVSANGSGGSFTVMLNDGTGAFPAVQQYAAGSDVSLLVAVDVNGDGYPDVITQSVLDQTVSVFLNNGDGTFATPSVYHVGGPVGTLTVTDLNGDGYPDMYLESASEYLATLTPPPGTPGSQELFNKGDGTFTVSPWVPNSLGSGGYGGTGGSVSLSSGSVTVSYSNIAQMLGSTDITPSTSALTAPTSAITVVSGGKITLAGSTSTTVTTTNNNGGVNQPSGSGKSSGGTKSSTATGSSSGGGGTVGWLSLLFLGVTRLLRRKRA